MNKRIDTYIAEVLGAVRCKKVHREIREELTNHIDELVENYMSQGFSKEEAIRRSLLSMGDAREVGQKLNHQHKPQIEWSILTLMGLICCFGLVMIHFCQTMTRNAVSFERYLYDLAIGALLLLGAYHFDYNRLKKYPLYFYGGSIFLMICCMIFGVSVNGVRRYLMLPGFTISVQAVSGFLFLLSFCGFLEKYRNKGLLGIGKLLGWGGLSLLILLLQPSAATAILLSVCYGVVLLFAIFRKHFGENYKKQATVVLSLGGSMIALGSFFLLWNQPYRLQKVLLFLDHGASDPQGGGWLYQMIQQVLEASRWLGRGDTLANGYSIDWVLPDIAMDYAFLNIIYSFGWIFGVLLMVLVVGLLLRMFSTISKVKNPFGKLLSLICCVMLGIQFILSILMNLGLCPLIEVSMPFVSYGGTQCLINMLYVGIVLSVWRTNNLESSSDYSAPRDTQKKKRITFSDYKLVIDFTPKGE